VIQVRVRVVGIIVGVAERRGAVGLYEPIWDDETVEAFTVGKLQRNRRDRFSPIWA
jgi:hypothetical protein